MIKTNPWDDHTFMNRKGQELLNKNDFFRDLSKIMENKEFSLFLQKYMFNSLEIQNSLLYIKLYETVKNKLDKTNKKNVDKNVIIYIIYSIMTDRKYRKIFVNVIGNFIKESSNNNELLENLVKEKKMLENLKIIDESKLLKDSKTH